MLSLGAAFAVSDPGWELIGSRTQPALVSGAQLLHPTSDLLGCAYLTGVDVSSYQGIIDWNSLSAAKDFVMMRSTCGVTYVDPKFAFNQSEARRVGILRGYYHFSYPDRGNSAIDEADHMLGVIGPLQPGETLCLDYERSYSDCVNWCLEFLNRVYSQTGVKPLIYLNSYTIRSFDWSPVIDAGYPLWLACWNANPDPTIPTRAWPSNAMKQHSSTGSVCGIEPIDLDSFNGDYARFLTYGAPATAGR